MPSLTAEAALEKAFLFKALKKGDSMKADKTLDGKGLFCPMPVFEASKAIKKIEIGQILEVLATDPASVPDLKHGHREQDMNYWSRR